MPYVVEVVEWNNTPVSIRTFLVDQPLPYVSLSQGRARQFATREEAKAVMVWEVLRDSRIKLKVLQYSYSYQGEPEWVERWEG